MQKTGRLELTWVGKYEEPVVEPRILLEDKDKSYGDASSENMFIHGDNLIALQALQQDFSGKIKCIYIDPPYNTGSAFEYYDDNLEHSIWLSMMKKRLVLLRELLAEDGTIWIQIDDEEQAYLKVLCDEIFGRGNFINKQNSEYIQATSRIGRAFPGLVVTLYNAYRPRDLSHYENFTGYHSQLYRFVEGTTATPFSARARDRVLHALVISAIRLNFPNMANNPDAAAIGSLTAEQIESVKKLILDRLNIIKPSARADAEEEIDRFIDWWKLQAAQTKPLRYYVVGTERYNRLMNPYDQPHNDNEKATLRSMREVESSANMFYYTEE